MQNLFAAISGEQRRGDIRGGLQAAALSLPLALAFGILSGAGPVAGFYGAICVGFLAAMVGGTQAQISGPTGPTALVLAAVIASFPGAPEKVFTVVMLAGFAQILFGALGLGKYAYLLPYPVISGWASGIGTVIIIMQLAPLLGLPPMSHPTQALMHLSRDFQHFNAHALALGLLTLGLTFSVPARFKHLLPPHLLALLLGTLAGSLFLTNAPTLGPIETILPTLQAFSVSQADMNTMLFAALSIALLGSIDSLLASMTADARTHTYHNSDRELVGQGLGNLVAGLLGAVPGAGATVRTMTNIHWGGRTRLSGMVCSGTLLLTLLLCGLLLERIPVAVLSGILIKVALDIIDWRYLRRIRTAPRTGLALMFTVMALTVIFNLVLAVAVGVVAASLLFVKRMADVELEAVKTFDNTAGETSLSDREALAVDQLAGKALIIRLSGPMSFGAANRLHRRLAGYERYKVLILDLRDVPSADSSAIMALENIINIARDEHQTVIVVGLKTGLARKFATLGVLSLIREVERYQDLHDALDYAATVLETDQSDVPAGQE
ncbi:MAG: SulP family inorganic anion transporter [Gammaproteobacteria bacterium]|nr:SulP family inorganic anion transporter [Gammaproteobacteria bacterium]